jgi:hypothetical protein
MVKKIRNSFEFPLLNRTKKGEIIFKTDLFLKSYGGSISIPSHVEKVRKKVPLGVHKNRLTD